MVDLISNGKLISRHETRADALVTAFERGFTEDSHSRTRRNCLKRGVRVVGEDGDYVEERYDGDS